MDIFELIRRWHDKHPISHIAKALGINRQTVRKYSHAIQKKGISLEQPLPLKEQVLLILQDIVPETQCPAKAQALLKPLL